MQGWYKNKVSVHVEPRTGIFLAWSLHPLLHHNAGIYCALPYAGVIPALREAWIGTPVATLKKTKKTHELIVSRRSICERTVLYYYAMCALCLKTAWDFINIHLYCMFNDCIRNCTWVLLSVSIQTAECNSNTDADSIDFKQRNWSVAAADFWYQVCLALFFFAKSHMTTVVTSRDDADDVTWRRWWRHVTILMMSYDSWHAVGWVPVSEFSCGFSIRLVDQLSVQCYPGIALSLNLHVWSCMSCLIP